MYAIIPPRKKCLPSSAGTRDREGKQYVLDGTLCHLLVHDFPHDVVHVERYVALVLYLRVEIEKSLIMY